MKTCTKCEVEKPERSFGKAPRNSDGLKSLCKNCQRVYDQAYYSNNKRSVRESTNSWRKRNPVKTQWSVYKASAKKRGFDFHLRAENFSELANTCCEYCGTTGTLGFDRIDSNLGYLLDNVAPCCKICNRAKSNMPLTDFMKWIEQLVQHRQDG